MNIEELKKQAHKIAVENGFWNDCEIANNQKNEEEKQIVRNLFVSQKLLLIISELMGAVESLRTSKRYTGSKELLDELSKQFGESPNMYYMRFVHHIKGTFEDELADTMIRIADLCEEMNIDLETFVKMKMNFNSLRQDKQDKNF
jgi:NTP pyrophosphatase (non-canonical NTP hydrolase)